MPKSFKETLCYVVLALSSILALAGVAVGDVVMASVGVIAFVVAKHTDDLVCALYKVLKKYGLG